MELVQVEGCELTIFPSKKYKILGSKCHSIPKLQFILGNSQTPKIHASSFRGRNRPPPPPKHPLKMALSSSFCSFPQVSGQHRCTAYVWLSRTRHPNHPSVELDHFQFGQCTQEGKINSKNSWDWWCHYCLWWTEIWLNSGPKSQQNSGKPSTRAAPTVDRAAY